MFRHSTPFFLRFDPFLEWSMKPSIQPAVYLTFDDGPHPEITPWVLNVLAAHQAKATFFCVGENVLRYPEVYRQILNAGHAVGNHTHNHLNGWKHHANEYTANIELAAAHIHSNLFRPPYGKLSPLQALRLKKKGLRIIMWSLLTRDFDKHLDHKKALDALISHTKNGAVVLFHDSDKARVNLEVLLPKYLEHFQDKGFQFRSL